MKEETAIHVRDLRSVLGGQVIHDGVSFDTQHGEVMGVVGGSGTGKSVLLKMITGLLMPVSGEIKVFGQSVFPKPKEGVGHIVKQAGVLFQNGALFSSLTVAENIQVPIKENYKLPQKVLDGITKVKLDMVGLTQADGHKYPSEISGGMRKRAGLARALALDPKILFLDEPTAGLDPIRASAFDDLIKNLKHSLDLTVLMVTHDLDSLIAICDKIAVLVDKKIVVGTYAELLKNPDQWIHSYFHGTRGRAVQHKDIGE